jgi:PGM1 C-terminal domain
MGAAIVSGVCRDGASLLYVVAPQVDDEQEQLDYFLRLLPADHGELADRRDRFHLVSVADGSARWLSAKILDTERADSAEVRKRIRDFVDHQRQFGADIKLSYYEPSANIEQLAAELGIARDQADSRYIELGSKGGSREIFASVGVAMPAGSAECHRLDDLTAAIAELVRAGHGKFVLKLSSNEYGGGLGNAILDLTELLGSPAGLDLTGAVAELLPERTVLIDPKFSWPEFASSIGHSGVIAEELIEGLDLRSPSFQGAIDAAGEVSTISTHEQLLDSSGQIYAGSLFPAADEYRAAVIAAGQLVGWRLAELGVRGGDYGVDFIAVRRGSGWKVFGCELNLRTTATNHGFVMSTTLLGVVPDEKGTLRVDGAERVYYASDGIASPRYVGLRPRQLIAALQSSPLGYDHDRKTGVVLHMLSAVAQYGKFGAVCIGLDRVHAVALMTDLRTLADSLSGP